MRSLLVIGAGGHGIVVADAAAESGRWAKIAFLDDVKENAPYDEWPIVGKTSDTQRLLQTFGEAAVAIGSNTRRLELVLRLIEQGWTLPPIVHPSAFVSGRSRLGDGTVVLAQAAVNAAAVLGKACIVNTGAAIDHQCVLEDGVHVSPGAHLAGGVVVGSCSWLGLGSSVRENVRIGRNSVLGAGAVAVSTVEDNATAVGVPARVEQLTK